MKNLSLNKTGIQKFQQNIFKPNDDYTGDLTKSENIDLYLQNIQTKVI